MHELAQKELARMHHPVFKLVEVKLRQSSLAPDGPCSTAAC